ncbi:hypothetical protein ACMU_12690 [Actibacterium mucosum KCTC 23349]|uniref:Copper chaperone PCu(A)C n=1 Tax=Actibacterium mucosum KCTC 23349 TaxID=1454373 RepID=A0A037ZIT3_9RHOB|nr:copper chaperone PCu(A)C [Actibacterium mucosum]KAJ55544.1 hypothetical protein ACMU_12690 [Actibacterium mucosum KCTC 23349]
MADLTHRCLGPDAVLECNTITDTEVPMRAFAIALMLAATPVLASEDHDDDAHHLAEAEGIRILHAWAREGEARIYMEIENTGEQSVTLEGGEIEGLGELVLMAMPISATGGDIAPIKEMRIRGGGAFALTPEGMFLMLEAPADWTAGQHVDAHVALHPLGEVEIEVEVFAAGTDQHPHAGHNH